MRLRVFFAALAACLVVSSAVAATATPPTSTAQNGSWNPSPYAATFDPGAVATGAAVNSGNMDTRMYRSADCEFTNVATGASRSVQAECWDPTFATTVGQLPTITVATGQTAVLVFDPDSAGTTHPDAAGSSVTVYPFRPCAFLTVKSASASGVARVLCTLRSH
jgi:hypothetical protein